MIGRNSCVCKLHRITQFCLSSLVSSLFRGLDVVFGVVGYLVVGFSDKFTDWDTSLAIRVDKQLTSNTISMVKFWNAFR